MVARATSFHNGPQECKVVFSGQRLYRPEHPLRGMGCVMGIAKRWIGALWLLLPLVAWSETLVVGLPEPGRKPFFWQDEQHQFQGRYIALLKRISAMAGVELEFKMVPQARLIAEFQAERIHIEPGIAPVWRASPGEQAISRYTQAFSSMDDVLIFPKGQAVEGITSMRDLPRLNGMKVGQVRGFYVPEGLNANLFANEFDIARLVNSESLDAGIMNAYVAMYLRSENHFDYEISAPYESTPVAFRFNKRQEKWVKPFDKAITQLRSSGELAKILSAKSP